MESGHHQLSAIMFSDIVGYTAMMGRDEKKGLELLKQNREIHKPLISKYRGYWIKEMGDGMLARFDSAYDAVKCAIDIQETANNQLKGKLRIGLHIGEIIIEDEDIFGDGVNVASRIESIADPGAVYMSGAFQKSIRNHTDIRTRYLAKTELKNVMDPVEVYCIEKPGIAIPTRDKIRALKDRMVDKPSFLHRFFRNPIFYLLLAFLFFIIFTSKYWFNISPVRTVRAIAVLPFTNLTGSDQEQYLVDMMHDAVITEISKIGELIVKSRTSTLQFRDKDIPIPEIARILKVDAIIEGTVTKAGDSIYMNVQLVRTRPEEDHIWGEDYIRDIRQILTFYGELARSIAGEVEIQLTPQEEILLTHDEEVNPEAYKAYLKGHYHWKKLTKESIDSAEYYYKKSMEIDPNYALAYAGLSGVALFRAQNGLIPFYESSISNIKFLEKAQELDSTQSEIHFLEACFNTWGMWDFDQADKNFRKAISLNPNHSLLRVYYANLLCYFNKNDSAIIQCNYALRLDPLNNLVKGIYAKVLNNCRYYEQADSLFSVVLKEDPYDGLSLSNKKSTYHMQKRYSEAFELWQADYRKDAEALRVLETGYATGGYPQALENLADLMVERSKTEFVTPWRIGTLYTRAGLQSKAIGYLEKAYDVHDQNMPSIICDPIFDYLRDDKRFQVLIDKMNFPK